MKYKPKYLKLPIILFITIITCFVIKTNVHAQKNYELLSLYSTNFDTTQSRAQNIRIAASRISNVQINPGQSFSFNKTILPRTAANGYVDGPQFIGGKTVNGIGGGICQVSSTLYACLLFTDMTVTERHPHGKPVTYIPKGMDATISGNTLDLKFTNNTGYPVKIMTAIDEQSGTLAVALWKVL